MLEDCSFRGHRGTIAVVRQLLCERENNMRYQPTLHGWIGIHACALWLLGLLAPFTGCALPDVSQFTASTIELRGAIVSTGDVVVSELRRTDSEAAKAHAKTLGAAWATRIKLFDSLTDYANSLQAIVDAGLTGEQAARELADNVELLARAAGIVQPGAGEAGAVVTETAAFVYGQIARALAARSLTGSLQEVQPAISRIADVIGGRMEDGKDPSIRDADLPNMEDLVVVAAQLQRNHLKGRFQERLGYREQLLAAQVRLYNEASSKLAETTEPSTLGLVKEIEAIEKLLAESSQWYAEYHEDLTSIAKREKAALNLIQETGTAMSSWAAAHARLLGAVREGNTVSVEELGATVVRIRQLVEKVRAL